MLPGQQGLPGWPQVEHTALDDVLLHTSPLPRHTVVELVLEVPVVLQQVSPALLPHRAQIPETHFVPDAVHNDPVPVLVPEVQQGLPGPPHAPALQVPALQVPGTGKQELPLATHMPEMQQPLLVHALPEQQSCPGPPQAPPPLVVPPAPLPPLPVPPDPVGASSLAASCLAPPEPSATPPEPLPPDALPPVPSPPSPPDPVSGASSLPESGWLLDPLQP